MKKLVLATSIAKAIMTVRDARGNIVVERIAMMKLQKDGKERAIAGRNTPSVVSTIQQELEKFLL